MSEFWQTVIGILGSVGIGGAVVAALSSWLGKVWANRLMAEEKAKYEKELERLSKHLERKNYVSKVRFDAEFAIYRELSKTLVIMEQNASLLFPESGLFFGPQDTQAQKELYQKNYQAAFNAYIAFSHCLASNCAFISEKIFQDFESIRKKVCHQVNFYPMLFLWDNKPAIAQENEEKCWRYTAEIYKEQQALQNKLREYLKTLDVMDEK